jgi:TonB family protein
MVNMNTSKKTVSTLFLGAFALMSVLNLNACSSTQSETDQTVEEEQFIIVELMPAPEGGLSVFYEYLQNELEYPKEARESEDQETVEVQFIVERDGSLTGVEATSGSSPALQAEAIRVVSKFEGFVPGRQRGRAVRVRMSVPIQFKLTDELDENGNPKGIVVIEELEVVNESLQVDASYADGTWSGVVSTSDGETIPGSSIIIKGTSRGTVSDLEGKFRIEADESQELVVSFVGYETQLIQN